MSIRLCKDNHDSWGTCTTSAECKTVITVMLTVMSGMDLHMISGNLGWVVVKSWLGCVKVGFIRLWLGHGETLLCGRGLFFDESSSLLVY
jgi:hypothetical protein